MIKIDQIGNYLIEEISPNEVISKKHKNVWKAFNYIAYCNIWLSVIGCVSISAFVSLVEISIGITNSAIGLEICVVTAGIKIHK